MPIEPSDPSCHDIGQRITVRHPEGTVIAVGGIAFVVKRRRQAALAQIA